MFSIRSYFKLGDISYLELGKRVMRKTSDDGCTAYAAAMAYYLLFALFPFFLFLTTLIGYLPIPNLLDFILSTMARFLPKEAFTLLQDNIRALFSNKQGGLLSLGFVLALWTSSSAITSIMDVMNRLYEVKEGRPFWKVRLIAMLLVAGLSVLFILSLVLLMFGPKIGTFIADFTGLGSVFSDRLEYPARSGDSFHADPGARPHLLLHTRCGTGLEMDQSQVRSVQFPFGWEPPSHFPTTSTISVPTTRPTAVSAQ